MAECLMGLAGVTCGRGEPQAAAGLFAAAEAMREGVGAARWPANRLEYERNLAALREHIDDGALSAVWAEGRG